jgi:PadR family transcriptional regulator PadR
MNKFSNLIKLFPPSLRLYLWYANTFRVTFAQEYWYLAVVVPQERQIMAPIEPKLDLLQGTLDLMVLQTLATLGPQHGYGIARRIEQVSGDAILLNQGTIYASLVRLQQRGWISAEWGTSDNNRKAKFYSITKRGRKQLSTDVSYWQRLTGVIGRVLAMENEREN